MLIFTDFYYENERADFVTVAQLLSFQQLTLPSRICVQNLTQNVQQG